jgi:hypothetical protein
MSNQPTTRLRAAVLVAAGTLACAGILQTTALPSAALLTDTEQTSAATVTSGSVSLALSGGAATGSWLGSMSLVPGGASYAGILVGNDGASRFRYSVTADSTGTLAPALRISVVRLADGATSCTSSTFSAGTSAGAPATLGASVDIVGDPSTGAQTGDRLLAAGSSERLCAKVELPFGSGLGASARGASASTTFTFHAENA